MGLSADEIKWLKEFIKGQKRLEAEELKMTKKLEKEESEKKDFLKKISSGEFIGNKKAPDYICKKCGKVKITSMGLAMYFPNPKHRCKCKKAKDVVQ